MAAAKQLFAGFVGNDLIVRGGLAEAVACCKARVDAGETARVVLYDNENGNVVDAAFSGAEAEILARLSRTDPSAQAAGETQGQKRRGPGRPALGVVSREVSLLPRHWQWLAEERGGASAALRRLVDAARKNESHEAVLRRAVDAAHRFMWDIAGDLPGFEEATRALYASDFDRLDALISHWPSGIREQIARYLDRARTDRPAPKTS